MTVAAVKFDSVHSVLTIFLFSCSFEQPDRGSRLLCQYNAVRTRLLGFSRASLGYAVNRSDGVNRSNGVLRFTWVN